MNKFGRILTKIEKEKVLKPFGENKGKKWTLKKMAKAVSAGSLALKKDEEKIAEINLSLNNL